jgi:hypothetical protein
MGDAPLSQIQVGEELDTIVIFNPFEREQDETIRQ